MAGGAPLSEGLIQIVADPGFAPVNSPILDIVFVHGLGGDALDSWAAPPDAFWPRWLAAKFEKCRVYSFGYSSSKLAGFLTGEGASLQDIASVLMDAMLSRDVVAPVTLFICHSLGGLVVKQTLRRCAESADSDYRDLGRSVAGVAFLGTPHTGANMVTSINHLLGAFLSKQTKQLVHAEDALVDLNDAFRTRAATLKVVSFYETEKTSGMHVVDKVSANPGLLGSEPVAVQADHVNMAKCATEKSPVYLSICRLVRKLLEHQAPPRPFTPPEQHAEVTDDGDSGTSTATGLHGLPSDIMHDFEYFTTVAEDDRRDLEQKLTDAGRGYAIRDAKRKKERFHMALQRNIAQSAAVTRYTRLMSEVESRFNRHVPRAIAAGAEDAAIDAIIQDNVISPCLAMDAPTTDPFTASLVDGALYYLAGNCHLAWDNG